MSLFALQYSYVNDPDLIARFRPDHRAFLGGLAAEGMLVLSGPLTPLDGAGDGGLLIFDVESAQELTERLREDPFQVNGVVATADVRAWNPVLGAWLERIQGDPTA